MSAQTNAQAPVDVLALFDALDGNTTSLKLNSQVHFARAAVAHWLVVARDIQSFHDMGLVVPSQLWDQHRAALARVGGA